MLLVVQNSMNQYLALSPVHFIKQHLKLKTFKLHCTTVNHPHALTVRHLNERKNREGHSDLGMLVI